MECLSAFISRGGWTEGKILTYPWSPLGASKPEVLPYGNPDFCRKPGEQMKGSGRTIGQAIIPRLLPIILFHVDAHWVLNAVNMKVVVCLQYRK